jgi:tubulin-folding cofactor B
MSLSLYNSIKETVQMEDGKMLGYYSPADYDTLIVSCTSKERFVNYNDVSKVAKFEMSQQDYESRTDSVLEFKKKNKIGRFSDAANSVKDYSSEQELLLKIKIGDRCITLENDVKKGTVMYLGDVDFKEGPWVGISLDEPLGLNNGR